jgi:SAM-dependent methyltransferase
LTRIGATAMLQTRAMAPEPLRNRWDAVGVAWRDTHPHRLWRRHSDAVNHALFARWLPAAPVTRLLKTDVFDEAVSGGLYGLLRSRVGTLVGIDIAPVILYEAGRGRPDLHRSCADVRALPFAGDTFDVVVSNSTLDHFDTLEEIRTSLREIHRVLRADGRLLITLDNGRNPMIALRNALPQRLLQRLGLVPYQVGATCGPSRLARLLNETGFAIAQVGAVMHCWRVLAVALAGIVERRAGAEGQRRFLQHLQGWERLARWPTRFLTGHFIAIEAVKPAGASTGPR